MGVESSAASSGSAPGLFARRLAVSLRAGSLDERHSSVCRLRPEHRRIEGTAVCMATLIKDSVPAGPKPASSPKTDTCKSFILLDNAAQDVTIKTTKKAK